MTDSAFDLPEFSAEAAPEFNDVQTCKTWLEHVPLATVAEAQRQLLSQAIEFNRFPCKAAMRLQVMEALREAVAFVQIEQAKRFTNRALPMADLEAAIFSDTTALWENMRIGYLRCLAASQAGENGMRAHAALLAQRVLAYCGLKMFHHYRAYREVPGGDWKSLHATYKVAEELEVTEDEVKDYLNRDVHDASPASSTCARCSWGWRIRTSSPAGSCPSWRSCWSAGRKRSMSRRSPWPRKACCPWSSTSPATSRPSG